MSVNWVSVAGHASLRHEVSLPFLHPCNHFSMQSTKAFLCRRKFHPLLSSAAYDDCNVWHPLDTHDRHVCQIYFYVQ
jgi:hypothetical protein